MNTWIYILIVDPVKQKRESDMDSEVLHPNKQRRKEGQTSVQATDPEIMQDVVDVNYDFSVKTARPAKVFSSILFSNNRYIFSHKIQFYVTIWFFFDQKNNKIWQILQLKKYKLKVAKQAAKESTMEEEKAVDKLTQQIVDPEAKAKPESAATSAIRNTRKRRTSGKDEMET